MDAERLKLPVSHRTQFAPEKARNETGQSVIEHHEELLFNRLVF